ncbi:transposase [Persicitalea sp.]|uniref:IS110 family transposase n=1 Tax=Persicitalea sp. TaxID=3100273 RepID=UPI0035943277
MLSVSTGGARALSKATIDAALCEAEGLDHFTHDQFANTTAGFKRLLFWLVKQGADAGNSLVGMEHTGHCTLALCCFLQQSSIPHTLISPLHLKRCLGMARGKTGRPEARPRRRGPHRLLLVISFQPTIDAHVAHTHYFAHILRGAACGLQQDELATTTRGMALACFDSFGQLSALPLAEDWRVFSSHQTKID